MLVWAAGCDAIWVGISRRVSLFVGAASVHCASRPGFCPGQGASPGFSRLRGFLLRGHTPSYPLRGIWGAGTWIYKINPNPVNNLVFSTIQRKPSSRNSSQWLPKNTNKTTGEIIAETRVKFNYVGWLVRAFRFVGCPFQRTSAEHRLEVACPEAAHTAFSGTWSRCSFSLRSSALLFSPVGRLVLHSVPQGVLSSTPQRPNSPC